MIRFLQPMVEVLVSVLKGNRLGAAPSVTFDNGTHLPRVYERSPVPVPDNVKFRPSETASLRETAPNPHDEAVPTKHRASLVSSCPLMIEVNAGMR